MSLAVLTAGLFALQPTLPERAAPAAGRPIVTGGATANLVFGKIQRAAQLPGSRLAANPIAAVANQGALDSLLWGSFAMSNTPKADIYDREDLDQLRSLANSLLFVDATSAPAAAGFAFPGFGKKKSAAPGAAPELDAALLETAAARGATHAFVLLEGAAQLPACTALLGALPGLCATVIAPEANVALASTKGWVCPPLQDHEGALLGALAVRDGWEPAADDSAEGRLAAEAPASGSLAREDLAELVVQCALRLSRTGAEGAPALRVLRVSPAASERKERPVANYDTVIGGPKSRQRAGTVLSGDWSELLAPFGVVRRSDPADGRVLIGVE